ncbi:testis-specific gene 13 protein isoform X2 [Varanus komodoensis]|uniref:testis-specific gene 13 protein isoform X2 n=1 Tax=Varanus komodoensis TaxID=61221 RepID=UPI001CF7C1D6|nr:testis-specific gene 13 protein isoform X2 [Varanus komodoensis]XP_044284749.1 testis-specific gene 13 protein isoform X2 [Varanus komodoensis]
MSTHFCLKHEAQYTHHPNLIQYFIPVTDEEFQERLGRRRGEIAIMLRSSEFNQDKTTLIVTNNPLPLLVSGQQLSMPLQYFSKDVLRRSLQDQKPLSLPPLEKQAAVPGKKHQRKSTQFRFATAKDFKGEAKFSKGYAERRVQRLYPHLHTSSRLGQQEKQPLPSIQGWVPKVAQWEPLTITCLAETKVTLTAPGEDGFRYGKAPLWVVETSLVPRNTQ